MKLQNISLIAVFFIAGLLAVNLIAQSNRNQQAASDTGAARTEFEYATLTTVISGSENETTYELIWNAGIRDFVGTSTTSLNDARRKLISQLGLRSTTQTNLSVLLTSIGSEGWRLVESSESKTGLIRIFIR